MRLALFDQPGVTGERVGLVTDAGVIAIDRVSTCSTRPTLGHVIDHFDELCDEIAAEQHTAPSVPIADVRLGAPLTRHARILCCMRARSATPVAPTELHLFFKGRPSAIGADGEVVLPDLDGAAVFTHNVAVAIVIAGPVRDVPATDWRSAVFGYTALIDITARTASQARWKDGRSCLGASCDTFGPLGPWIVPAADIDTSAGLAIRMRNGPDVRQDYRLHQLDDHLGEVVRFASSIMTLNSGDIIAVDGPAGGQGPVQDGDRLCAELDQVGALTVTVRDPLARRWDRDLRIAHDRDDADVSALVR